ncbi:DUF397 domain-containing protein [Streptomyces apocyni]|uniref:DUF397 domain-containing protein n=1 Tax=Streptomyces apocyni TaxID=2654677 RepID=UPI0012EAF794|nr:DUF397 domain-containing protein [Streptomyces apocyni]
MPEIDWQEPFCGGDGGNACLQLGFTADGTPHLRETANPEEVITTTRDGLRHLVAAARRGDLPHIP